MPRWTRSIPAFVLICLLAVAAPEAGGAEFSDRADAAARSEMEKQKLVGLAVGLIRDGEIVHLGGYGYADRDAGVEVDPDRTMFRWASISKPLTAISAVQLWETGELDLDKPVREYVPEFPDKDSPITTRQLLGHLGGIVHYTNGKVVKTKRTYDRPNPYGDVILALDTFKESPLVHAPGETLSYSTHGFILASAVVQRAGGQPFHEQVRERIAEPLEMTTLRPDYQWEEIPDRAVGYRKPKKKSTDTDVSWKLGGGGFISTVADLTRFAKGLIDGELLSAESYAMMWAPATLPDGEPTNYGLGFVVGGEGLDYQIAHSGSQEKTRTLMVVFPEQDAAIVIMTNSEYANTRKIASALAPLLRKEEATTAP